MVGTWQTSRAPALCTTCASGCAATLSSTCIALFLGQVEVGTTPWSTSMVLKKPCKQNKIVFATFTTKYCFARVWYLAPLSHQNSAEPDTGGQGWQAALWSLLKLHEVALTVGSSEKSSLLFKMLHSAMRVWNNFLSSVVHPPFQEVLRS